MKNIIWDTIAHFKKAGHELIPVYAKDSSSPNNPHFNIAVFHQKIEMMVCGPIDNICLFYEETRLACNLSSGPSCAIYKSLVVSVDSLAQEKIAKSCQEENLSQEYTYGRRIFECKYTENARNEFEFLIPSKRITELADEEIKYSRLILEIYSFILNEIEKRRSIEVSATKIKECETLT